MDSIGQILAGIVLVMFVVAIILFSKMGG